MCCGSGSSDVASERSVADPAGRPSDDQVYVVAYHNGVTEEVVGLDAARTRIVDPSSRVEGARDASNYPPGTVMSMGTYARKVNM